MGNTSQAGLRGPAPSSGPTARPCPTPTLCRTDGQISWLPPRPGNWSSRSLSCPPQSSFCSALSPPHPAPALATSWPTHPVPQHLCAPLPGGHQPPPPHSECRSDSVFSTDGTRLAAVAAGDPAPAPAFERSFRHFHSVHPAFNPDHQRSALASPDTSHHSCPLLCKPGVEATTVPGSPGLPPSSRWTASRSSSRNGSTGLRVPNSL